MVNNQQKIFSGIFQLADYDGRSTGFDAFGMQINTGLPGNFKVCCHHANNLNSYYLHHVLRQGYNVESFILTTVRMLNHRGLCARLVHFRVRDALQRY